MKKNPATKKADAIHALNNLLASSLLLTETLLKEFYGKLNAQQKRCLKSILDDGKKIQRTIKKLPKT